MPKFDQLLWLELITFDEADDVCRDPGETGETAVGGQGCQLTGCNRGGAAAGVSAGGAMCPGGWRTGIEFGKAWLEIGAVSWDWGDWGFRTAFSSLPSWVSRRCLNRPKRASSADSASADANVRVARRRRWSFVGTITDLKQGCAQDRVPQ